MNTIKGLRKGKLAIVFLFTLLIFTAIPSNMVGVFANDSDETPEIKMQVSNSETGSDTKEILDNNSDKSEENILMKGDKGKGANGGSDDQGGQDNQGRGNQGGGPGEGSQHEDGQGEDENSGDDHGGDGSGEDSGCGEDHDEDEECGGDHGGGNSDGDEHGYGSPSEDGECGEDHENGEECGGGHDDEDKPGEGPGQGGPSPGISLVQSVDNSYPRIGDTVTYSYEITNTGNVTLTNITLVSNTLLISISLDKTTLEPNESITGDYVYQIREEDINENNEIKNVAKVEGKCKEGRVKKVCDTAEVTIAIDTSPVEPTHYEVTVEKKWIDAEGEPIEKPAELEWEITIDIEDGNPIVLDQDDSDGRVTFTVPFYKRFTISENISDDYVVFGADRQYHVFNLYDETTEEFTGAMVTITNQLVSTQPPAEDDYGTLTLYKAIENQQPQLQLLGESETSKFSVRVHGGGYDKVFELEAWQEYEVPDELELDVEYTIEEVDIPEGFELVGIYQGELKENTVTFSSTAKAASVTIVNKEVEEQDPPTPTDPPTNPEPKPDSDPEYGKIKIIKTIGSEEGEPQAGVVFEIKKGSYEKAKETNEDGIALFTRLDPGTYSIKEIVPEGYTTNLEKDFTVRVRADKTVEVKVVNSEIAVEESEGAEETKEPEEAATETEPGTEPATEQETTTPSELETDTTTATTQPSKTTTMPDLPNTGGPMTPEVAVAGLGTLIFGLGVALKRKNK